MLKFSRFTRLRLVVVGAVLLTVVRMPEGVASPPGCDTTPTGVATADHYIDFRTSALMPGVLFDDRDASLRVHTVSPVYANGKCPGVPNQAVVLVHGATIPAVPVFDLRIPGSNSDAFSLQATLARAGIHTFAPDLLGYGGSTRFADGLDNPCNASLPTDQTRNPGIIPLDLQGRYLGDGLQPVLDGLGVNPLDGVRCPHTSSTYFANVDVFVSDVMQVIDDAIARARPRGGKVVLVGYSFGGVVVGRTLYRMGDEADRKIRRVVFTSSVFNRPPGATVDVNLATEEAQLSVAERSTSFPLMLTRIGGWTGVGANTSCTGRVPDGAQAAYGNLIRETDPLGATWGGSDTNNPTGLSRSPTFSIYGWNPAVASTLTLPSLVLQGADDTTVPKQNAENIFQSMTALDNRVLVTVACSSHQMHMEGCSQTRCTDNDPATIPYGGTSQTWAGPHATAAAAIVEWVKYGTFDGSECGRFDVNTSGIASEVATPACES